MVDGKRKYSILFLFFCIFMFSGCDVTYNLKIDNKFFLESTNFISTSHEESSDFEKYVIGEKYKSKKGLINNNVFYKNKIIDEEYKGINLSYKYNYNDFNTSSLLNYCFDEGALIYSGNYIIIDAKNSYQCFIPDIYNKIDSITINIKTDLKVIKNNADKVKGNVYTWKLTRDNASEKNIYLKLRKKVDSFVYFIFVIIVILVVGGFYLYNYSKKRKESINEV